MNYPQQLLVILMTLTVSAAQAENKKEAAKDSLRFTVIKENPITPVKNQSRSGTCWDYATIGFFEGEILHKNCASSGLTHGMPPTTTSC
jgi:C1A family cysteine protease